ncbi:MAG: glycosyltransferase family 39 protein [Chloroflexi bacterium]|nr:glycosyltransferase family 39 protein [Chloroflexota bacterium]
MRRLFTLILILFIAFTLRVHLLGNQELRGDEGFSWNYIQDSPGEILARIIREGDPQPPIHYWLLWGWAKMTGETEFAMRAWSALLSLMLVPLMYQVGRRLWREEVGLLAASLTAIHPQQIWLAQDVRNMYQLALIALLVATLLLPKLIHHEDTKTRRHTKKIFYWLGYVACGTFAMYSHYYALFPLMAHGAYVLASSLPGDWKSRPQNSQSPPARASAESAKADFAPRVAVAAVPTADAWSWLTAGLAIAALVAPWAITILPVYSRGQLADPGSLPFTQYATAVLGDLTAGPAFPEQIKLIIAAAFFLISFFSIFALSPRLLVYLLSSLLIPFLGTYAIVAVRATFNTFYLVFAFPAAYLLAAGGLHALHKKFPPLGAAIIVISIAAFVVGLNNQYTNPQYSKTRGLREVAAHLAESDQPGDIYLANFPDPVQVYYTHNLGVSYHMLPGKANDHSDAELSQLIAGRIWFVPVNAPNWDADAYVQNRLLNTAILSEDQHFNKMRLMLFIPPTEAEPLTTKFADGIRLVGYHLAPGRLTLVWVADSAPTADYTIFVHALAGDGYNVVGHDAPPKVSTSQWRPDRLIVDVHEFDIPTDQPISLVVGMYLPSTGERLRLETAGFGEPDAALVASLEP